jgi:hypothetical protein
MARLFRRTVSVTYVCKTFSSCVCMRSCQLTMWRQVAGGPDCPTKQVNAQVEGTPKFDKSLSSGAPRNVMHDGCKCSCTHRYLVNTVLVWWLTPLPACPPPPPACVGCSQGVEAGEPRQFARMRMPLVCAVQLALLALQWVALWSMSCLPVVVYVMFARIWMVRCTMMYSPE